MGRNQICPADQPCGSSRGVSGGFPDPIHFVSACDGARIWPPGAAVPRRFPDPGADPSDSRSQYAGNGSDPTPGSPSVHHCGQTLAAHLKKFPFGTPVVPRFGRCGGANSAAKDSVSHNGLKRYVANRKGHRGDPPSYRGTSGRVRSGCWPGLPLRHKLRCHRYLRPISASIFSDFCGPSRASKKFPSRFPGGDLLVPQAVLLGVALSPGFWSPAST